jgi:hypothetical protein
MREVQRDGRLDETIPCRGCSETASYVWERAPAQLPARAEAGPPVAP